MARTLLDSYKEVEERQYLLVVCLTISIIIMIILLTRYNLVDASYIKLLYNYSSLLSSYSSLNTTLHLQFAPLQSSFAAMLIKYNKTEQNLTALSKLYNKTEQNLTAPYTSTLYSNYAVNIPKRNFSQSNTIISYSGSLETVNITSSTTYYTYNFSFNALYPGYLLFNGTSTGVNSQTNSSWEVLVSNNKIIPNGTLQYYNFQSRSYYQNIYTPAAANSGTYKVNFDQNSMRSIYSPTPSQASGTIQIPVGSGIVHVWIVNFNNQSATVTFSAKYFGLHTS